MYSAKSSIASPLAKFFLKLCYEWSGILFCNFLIIWSSYIFDYFTYYVRYWDRFVIVLSIVLSKDNVVDNWNMFVNSPVFKVTFTTGVIDFMI